MQESMKDLLVEAATVAVTKQHLQLHHIQNAHE
jgi:hypothetical protein